MNEKKSYEVSILGESYVLVSDEPEDHVLGAAQLVNRYMQDIEHVFSKNHSQFQRAFILTAIRMASDLQKCKDAQNCLFSVKNEITFLVDRVSSILSS